MRIEAARATCDFCNPLVMTAFDPEIGRIETPSGVTAVNISMAASCHGLILFKEHHPLRWARVDIIRIAFTFFRWAELKQKQCPSYRWPALLWNCLGKAGASQLHGHAQMILCDEPLGHVRRWSQAATIWRDRTGGHYFSDLIRAHELVGLVRWHKSVALVATLTPAKENEILIVATTAVGGSQPLEHMEANEGDPFSVALFVALRTFRDRLGVRAFNASILRSPINGKTTESFQFARLVDRGAPTSMAADVAAFEMFLAPVVGNDPFTLIAEIDQVLAMECGGASLPPGLHSHQHLHLPGDRAVPSSWVLRWMSQISVGGTVLDLACGSGRNSVPLLQAEFKVIAVDKVTSGLDDLRQSYGLGNQLVVYEQDLESTEMTMAIPCFANHMPFDALVVCNYLHRPLNDFLMNCLHPAHGVLIYETYAVGNEHFGKPTNPKFLLKEGELLALALRHQMHVIAYEHVTLTEPPAHRKAVVQRICARKFQSKD